MRLLDRSTISAAYFAALLAAALGTSGVAHAQTAAQSPPPSCAACHQGTRAFAGRNAKEIAERLRAIRDGNQPHPPLNVDDTSDTALELLAEKLTTTAAPP